MPELAPRNQPCSTGENWWVTVVPGRALRAWPVSFIAYSAIESSRQRWKRTHAGSCQSITSGISAPVAARNLARQESQQQTVGQKVMSMKMPATG